jgi:23S rRNA pseudouridine1911/1915/1917 synthase
MRYVVEQAGAGQRLDVFLGRQLPDYSRAFLQRLIGEGMVSVNGEAEKPGYKLREADNITVSYDFEAAMAIPNIELPVIYENNALIVVDKPAGIISHARGRFWNEASVASFVRQKSGQPGERSGIVHRLDRATSGVMVCAKNSETLSWLQKQFSQRNVKKNYCAIVSELPEPREAIIDMPIERNPKKPQTFRTGINGKSARTAYSVQHSTGSYGMLKLQPLTGRTHQLRVHLKQIGSPIVGDTLYGGAPAERLMLHAGSLEITLPDGKRKTFYAPLPGVFNAYMQENL